MNNTPHNPKVPELATLVFTIVLVLLILSNVLCTNNRAAQVPRSKFDVYTGPTKRDGTPVVRGKKPDHSEYWKAHYDTAQPPRK